MPSTSISATLIRNEDHYIKMTSRLIVTPYAKIAWIVNSIVTVGCLIAFLCIDGKEVICAFYIPLDLAINIAKFGFFLRQYFDDKKS